MNGLPAYICKGDFFQDFGEWIVPGLEIYLVPDIWVEIGVKLSGEYYSKWRRNKEIGSCIIIRVQCAGFICLTIAVLMFDGVVKLTGLWSR